MNRTEAGRIYIVDDDEGVRDSARALLESYDHVVRDFASARDFLAEFETMNAGCLLLDVNMPEMNGIELLELLRDRGNSISVIVVTAQRDPSVLERARRAGAYAVLEKPVGEKLIDTITTLFTTH